MNQVTFSCVTERNLWISQHAWRVGISYWQSCTSQAATSLRPQSVRYTRESFDRLLDLNSGQAEQHQNQDSTMPQWCWTPVLYHTRGRASTFLIMQLKSHTAQRLESNISLTIHLQCYTAQWSLPLFLNPWTFPTNYCSRRLLSSVTTVMSVILVCWNTFRAFITIPAPSALLNVCYDYSIPHLTSIFKWHFNTSPHLHYPLAFYTLHLTFYYL